MQTHLELYGWEIRRVRSNYFNLYLTGLRGAAAGGPLSFITRHLRKIKDNE